jgi:hypothetical protein
VHYLNYGNLFQQELQDQNAKSPEQDELIDGVQFITRSVYSGNATGQREFLQ